LRVLAGDVVQPGIECRSSWTTTDSLAFGMLRPFGNEFGGGGILGFMLELPGTRGRRRTVSAGSCVGQGAGRVMFQRNTQSDLPVGFVGGDHRHCAPKSVGRDADITDRFEPLVYGGCVDPLDEPLDFVVDVEAPQVPDVPAANGPENSIGL